MTIMTTSKNLKVSAIICAAGKGERAGFAKNKLLMPLSGAPALYHILEKFNIPEIDEVIITSSKRDFKEISALAAPFGYKVTLGGRTRTESVKRALKKVTGDIVLVHDGARPYVSRELIIKCIESVERFGSGVCALPLTDTIAATSYGQIVSVPERDEYRRIQTPQGFMTEDLRRAYTLAGEKNYTDDSSVFAEFIQNPRIIDGEETNLKLTYAEDFRRDMPALPASDGVKVGFGVDVHAFGEGDHVVLAGVKIPCNGGLVAHSDGDVIMHAVTDAVLSAAGLKDIGHFFPDNDPTYAGADSCGLFKTALAHVKAEGYVVSNISVSVQAERPRLAAHIDGMCENLSKLAEIPRNNVAIAAGTCEKLGFVGAGLGIVAYAFIQLKTLKN